MRMIGGMDYSAYLESDVWQVRRQWKLDAAEHRCQICNSGMQLQVHHRTYERIGREKECDLVVLCDTCHRLFHGITDNSPADTSAVDEIRRAAPENQVSLLETKRQLRIRIEKDGKALRDGAA